MTDTPAGMDDQVDGTPAQMDGNGGQVDGSLTIKAAAARLGVSERTIRRRIKDRVMDAQQVPTAQGYEWRVYLDSMPDQVNMPPTRQPVKVPGATVQVDGTAPSSPELLKALDLVDRLQRDNQQLAGQVGFLQAKLQDAEHKIALLEAPRDEPAPRRPWWRWWWQ